MKIYLDDLRTPVEKDWVVVRDFYQFVHLVSKLGLEHVEMISLDHDLGDTAVKEYFNNTKDNYEIDYNNIHEKTGYDCAKWLVKHFYNNYDLKKNSKFVKGDNIIFPQVVVHSANPIGSANIMGYINNFLKNERQEQNCVRVKIEHTV
jgi:hypothetical protein